MYFRIVLKMTATSGFLTALELQKSFSGGALLSEALPRLPSWFKVEATSERRGGR